MPRPRTLAPIVLLAATLGTASASPTVDAQGYPVVGNAMNKAGPGPKPTLEEVREKLLSTEPSVVKADLRPFRMLCDDKGYPLVGNAMSASKMKRIQPSEYCELVRKSEASKK